MADPAIWRVTEDVLRGTVTVTSGEAGERWAPDRSSSLRTSERLEMTARDRESAVAELAGEVVYRLRDELSDVAVEASATIRSTETDFHMNVELRVTLDGDAFFERGWLEVIPRRLV